MGRQILTVMVAVVAVAMAVTFTPLVAEAADDYTVINNEDRGPGSLRHGLEAGYQKIGFAPNVRGISLESSLEFHGASLRLLGAGQQIRMTAPGAALVLQNVTTTVIKDLTIVADSGHSVYLSAPVADAQEVYLRLDRTTVRSTGGHGVFVDDSAGSPASVNVVVSNSKFRVSSSENDSVHVEEAGAGRIRFSGDSVTFLGKGRSGVSLVESGDGAVRYSLTNMHLIGGDVMLRIDEAGVGDVGGLAQGVVAEDTLLQVSESGPGMLSSRVFEGDLVAGTMSFTESGPGDVAINVRNTGIYNHVENALAVEESDSGDVSLRVTNFSTDDGRRADNHGVVVREAGAGDLRAVLVTTGLQENGAHGVLLEESGDGNLRAKVQDSNVSNNRATDLVVSQAGSGTGKVRIVNSKIGRVDGAGTQIIS